MSDNVGEEHGEQHDVRTMVSRILIVHTCGSIISIGLPDL